MEFVPGNDFIPGHKQALGALDDVVAPFVKRVKEIAGKNAWFGFRGSFATGIVGNPNKPRYGLPIDLDDFDIDALIVSDELAALYGNQRTRWGDRIGALDDLSTEIQLALEELPEFKGLRDEGFSFRIFTQEEADRMFDGTERFFTGD